MLVTLLTDFGLGSPYVAQMKGVLFGIDPTINVVDVTHGIQPQQTDEAAQVLNDVIDAFPQDTCHIVVVDPGVGSQRRILLARAAEQYLIAPDNGLLSLTLQRHRPDWVRELSADKFWRRPTSKTFHGRDIMAPVAAHLAKGVSPEQFGGEVKEWILHATKQPTVQQDQILGEISQVDSFGNLISNVHSSMLSSDASGACIRLRTGKGREREVGPLVSTYADGAPGDAVALVGSGGWVEIAIVNGNAAQALAAGRGDEVRLTW